MFYSFQLSIPSSTTKADPVRQVLPLAPGVITGVWVGFPPGCANLVHVTVFEREHQIIPSNTDMDIAWDDYVFAWDEEHELEGPPFELEARVWSDDDSYAHTVFIAFELTPAETAEERKGVLGFLQKLKQIWGM